MAVVLEPDVVEVFDSRKHGVSFNEAATVFADPDALDGPDWFHCKSRVVELRFSAG